MPNQFQPQAHRQFQIYIPLLDASKTRQWPKQTHDQLGTLECLPSLHRLRDSFARVLVLKQRFRTNHLTTFEYSISQIMKMVMKEEDVLRRKRRDFQGERNARPNLTDNKSNQTKAVSWKGTFLVVSPLLFSVTTEWKTAVTKKNTLIFYDTLFNCSAQTLLSISYYFWAL